MVYSIGKDSKGTKTFITTDGLIDAKSNPSGAKAKYNNQQWAKIRKLIKKEGV
jgi:hypothetical protein